MQPTLNKIKMNRFYKSKFKVVVIIVALRDYLIESGKAILSRLHIFKH